MKNVELFQLFAAKAFADLYESFPVSTTIQPQELAKAVAHGDITERDARIVAEHTLKWLCNTDYLLKEPHAPFTYVLSARGFEILNASPFPKPLADKPTSTPEIRKQNLGERFVAAVADAGTEELKSLTKHALEWGLWAAIAGAKAHGLA